MMSEEVDASCAEGYGQTPVAENQNAPQTIEAVFSAEEIGKTDQITKRRTHAPENHEIHEHHGFGILESANDPQTDSEQSVLYLKREYGKKQRGGQFVQCRILRKE